MIDLSLLNEAQRLAVTHGDGPALVLAGAGSGKTRVITWRIAWLIEQGVRPYEILAVTFTNKAAGEMQKRVTQLVSAAGARPTIGTCHSVSLRILRRWADRLGYGRSFLVYDTADQLALVRRVAREAGLDESAFPPRRLLSAISRAKNQLIDPAAYADSHRDFYGARVSEVYLLYQKRLRSLDAMDFDDLIGNHVRLLREHEDVRHELNHRFRHLLIDEYQDTNHAQYALIRLLGGEAGRVMAVGDEDQSIYKFRGADIMNILNFERDFPGARIIKLEQNYRSTGNILDAASGVVAHNTARKGKTLFTDRGAGEPIRVVTCDSEREEARFVLERILELRGESLPLAEMAVLFRTNAQSRPFEEELLNANLPYVVIGGTRFYERAEVKDILAFLRLSVRPHDAGALERVINVPARGIGATTVRALQEQAAATSASLWTIIEGELDGFSERARRAITEFRGIVHDLQRESSRPVPEFIELVFQRTAYRALYERSNDPQDEARLENLDELLNSAREFQDNNPDAGLGDYLDSITLMSDVDDYEEGKGVTLMTLHSAKGLEFRVVFLVGMEEGILPHSRSEEDIEEERRLCYVGMTRAKERLYCIHCYQRRIHGQLREQSPSPFIEEIPSSVREEIRLARQPFARQRWEDSEPNRWRSRDSGVDTAGNVGSFFSNAPVRFDPAAIRPARSEVAGGELKRGSRVRHEQFGEGVILRTEGAGGDAKLTVYFDRMGTKKFVAKYAKLVKI
ncbi:MAG TPA: UvrD-helicase domain-containing protein [Thermoanaerobaculia bacterium]|nr:UvrD-helicase domain-containing protein [Thermoanaerobaculia bacterium]